MPKFVYNIDLSQTEIQNAVIQVLATDPGTPKEGQIYYNSATKKLRQYNGTSWVEYGTGAGTGDVSSIETSTSDNQGVLFNGTTGKSIKASTFTGILKQTSGVTSVATAGTDYTTPTSTETFTNKTIDANGTGNSISNLEVADFAATAIVTESEGLNSSDNDTSIPTTAAVKDYADSLLGAADAMIYKGVFDADTATEFPAGDAGDTYKVSVAGTVDGVVLEVSDMIICTVDSTVAGTTANWNVIQTNIDGAVIGSASSTDNAIARFDGTTGKVIQNSSVVIDDLNNVSGIVNLTATGTTILATTLTGVLRADSGVVSTDSNIIRKYSADFETTDWAGSDPYTLTITNATHGLGATKYLTVTTYQDGTPNQQVEAGVTVSDTGEVVITSNSTFDGHYVIIG